MRSMGKTFTLASCQPGLAIHMGPFYFPTGPYKGDPRPATREGVSDRTRWAGGRPQRMYTWGAQSRARKTSTHHHLDRSGPQLRHTLTTSSLGNSFLADRERAAACHFFVMGEERDASKGPEAMFDVKMSSGGPMDRECADAVAAGNRKKKAVPGVVEVALMDWGVTFLSRYSQSAIRSRAQGRRITHELSTAGATKQGGKTAGAADIVSSDGRLQAKFRKKEWNGVAASW